MDEAGSPELRIEDNKSVKMRVSKNFADLVQKVRKKVLGLTYDSVKGTDSEITEIIAKKYISKGLV